MTETTQETRIRHLPATVRGTLKAAKATKAPPAEEHRIIPRIGWKHGDLAKLIQAYTSDGFKGACLEFPDRPPTVVQEKLVSLGFIKMKLSDETTATVQEIAKAIAEHPQADRLARLLRRELEPLVKIKKQ